MPGEYSAKISSETENIKTAINKTGKFYEDVAMGVGAVIMALYYGWELGLYILCYCPIIVFAGKNFAEVSGKVFKEGLKAYS